ncbi:MAG: ankyrin repeat domain-containing protein [Treponema sp.]|nr:ankyrin repeat domain-containing protein [Treponema sp.]
MRIRLRTVIQCVAAVVYLCLSLAPIHASGRKDQKAAYSALIASGTAGDIKKQLTRDGRFLTFRTETGDNILMQALTAGRDSVIIGLLLQAGANPTEKNADGQTAVIYAARFSTDEAIIRAVVSYGAPLKRTVQNRLLQRDAAQKDAVDYAYETNNAAAIAVARDYLSAKTMAIHELHIHSGNIAATYQPGQEKPAEQPPANDAATDDLPPTADPPPAQTAAVIEPPRVSEPPHRPAAAPQQDNAPAAAERAGQSPSPPELVRNAPDTPKASPPRTEPSLAPVLPAVPPSGEKARAANRIYLFDGIEPSQKTTPVAVPNPQPLIDVSGADAYGKTPLMKAAQAGDSTALSAILRTGAAVNARDSEGWTALMYAARYQPDEAIITQLIASGADITLKNNYGLTALEIAASYAQTERTIAPLLAAQSAHNGEITSAFIHALTASTGRSSAQQKTIVLLFLNSGADVNKFYHGKTPLMYVAQTASSTELLKLLLDRGARVNMYSTDGHTAFYYAQNNRALPHDDIYWSLNRGHTGN